MGISQEDASSASTSVLTPLGEACSRVDLTAIHEILETLGYKDDEGVANEVSNNPGVRVIFWLIINLTLYSLA